MHEVEAVLAGARSGHGRSILVSGVAGIGKTRFCEEVLDRATDSAMVGAWGSCWPDGGAPPLWPWQVVLDRLCGDDAVGLLAGDSGVPGVDRERFSRFTAITDQLRARCRTAPMLIIFDDVHAADPGAVLLCRFVARALRDSALVLVASRRTGADGSAATEVLEAFERECLPIALRHFDIHETSAFLRSAGAGHVDAALALAVLRLTGGNPLFLRRVAGSGIDHAGGGLRDAIGRAIEQVDAAALAVLQLAAVLGPSPPVTDVAALGGVAVTTVLDAVAGGAAAGLVTTESTGSGLVAFTHELVREELEAGLMPRARLDAHAAAAAVVRTGPRRAHHALRAAPRSPEDAARAVAACRAAAAEMLGGFAYERAATLLAEAAAAHETAGLGPLSAALLADWAEAVRSCGRLGDARALFDRAVAAADREDDAVLRAIAALGLGGVWVSEQRTHDERERVQAIQRRALSSLPAGEDRLRARLGVRIAAEAAYPGHDVSGVFDALAAARQVGDGATLAEALSLTHHALLTPEHAHQRLALAEELVTVASTAGDGLLGLMGLCWRTVDLFLLGDPSAERALAELRSRADALRCQGLVYIVAAMDVMLLIRAGRFDDAEAAAGECFDLGVAVGDADSLGYLGGQLLAIRWAQGREGELLGMVEEIAGSPTLAEDDIAYPAAVALLAARAGEAGRASAAIERLASRGIAGLPRSSTWLAGIAALVEAAVALDDADLARQTYDLLAPYANQVVMPSLAVACFGSAERSLGIAARTMGDVDAAVDHLERAVAVNVRIANWPATVIARAELAGALLERDGLADRERAAVLLRAALVDGEHLAMTGRVAAWSTALNALDRAPGVRLERQGTHWLVIDGSHHALVADLVGMEYLARLVAQPEVEVSVLDLAGAGTAVAGLSDQALIDPVARAAYEHRARDLVEELAQADADADLGRAERLRVELDALVEELTRVANLGGRTRTFAGPEERARTSVRKAIVRAIDGIAAVDTELGRHFRTSVTTGSTCCYHSAVTVCPSRH
jgi:tetratricopeptide (TPR) repeat protein